MVPPSSAPSLLETCVLKINLQCHEDCPQKIRKLLFKMGVQYVDIDIEKGLVTATALKLDPHKIVEKIGRCGKKVVVMSYDPIEATNQLPANTDTSNPHTPYDSSFPTPQHNSTATTFSTQQLNCTSGFPTQQQNGTFPAQQENYTTTFPTQQQNQKQNCTSSFPTQQQIQHQNCATTFPTQQHNCTANAAALNHQDFASNCPSQQQFCAAHYSRQHKLYHDQMQPTIVNNGCSCYPMITDSLPPAYPTMIPRRRSSRFFSRRGYPADSVLKPVWPPSQPAPLMLSPPTPPPPPLPQPANDYYYYYQPMQQAQLEHRQPPPSYDYGHHYGQYHYDCEHNLSSPDYPYDYGHSAHTIF